ncbi:TPA: tail fiber domain-containing protein [Enterobacter asburiae]|nr:tail fiber domain-containing protein [Enterobacter asburiae]HCD8881698.1 tail fiber domain-containing protein [Enterobacter asburiae]HDS9658324.1 tail fiber domain-containing protein [Klebsiella pneumoniae subsp. pneumoniae]HEO9915959.1 tail fiber domain-containing protein [Enterobacter asburiae]
MWYREGTKTLINGSNIVTGVGTSWSKAENGVLPGMILLGEKGEPYEIKSVESDTSLTLVEPYDGKNVNDTPCRIITTYQGDISQFSARFAAQLQRMNIDSGVIRSWLTSGQDAQLLAEDGTLITLKALRQIISEHEGAMAWFSANKDSILKAAANAAAAASSASAALASQKAAKTSETNSAGSVSAAASSKTAAAASATKAAASEKNAKASEVNAKTSETAASGSAIAAATSETSAKASQDSATSSAGKAATSEKNAAASATSAASSKGSAATSATSAATSATNSKTSESNAKKSEANAKASENEAAGSKSAAAASEANASTSEINAASSATAAKASETSAASSKSAAATSATNAKSSETNAASSKTAAATSASNAATSESNASTSEANAKKSETNAKASENAAASSNSNAGKSASAAKTSENNAAASASSAAASAKSLDADNLWTKSALTKAVLVGLGLAPNDAPSFTGGVAVAGTIKNSGEVQTTAANSYRMVGSNYGLFQRIDGANWYMMLTDLKDNYGTYNAFRPISIALTSGRVTMANGLSVAGDVRLTSGLSVTGALSASKGAIVNAPGAGAVADSTGAALFVNGSANDGSQGVTINSYAPTLSLIDRSASSAGFRWRGDGNCLRLDVDNRDNGATWNSDIVQIDEQGRLSIGGVVTADYAESFTYRDQWKTKAPFFNEFSSSGASEYHPLVKQKVTVGDNSYVASLGWLVNSMVFELSITDQAGITQNFTFRPNGEFATPARVLPGDYSNFDTRYLGIKANAVSASKLATARKIAGKAFDGTSDIAISAGDVKALPNTGGTVAGQVTVTANGAALVLRRLAASQAVYLMGRDEKNAARWYVGNGGTDDVVTIHNYIQNTTLQLNASELYTNRNIRAAGRLTINGTGESNAVVGSGSADVFLQNTKSGKYLQLKDTGDLMYSNQKIYHAGNKPTAAEVGALSSSGGQVSGEVVTTSANGFRIKYGSVSSFFRSDGANSYFLLTNSGDQDGAWNGLRPLAWNNTTGVVTMSHNVTVGGALTANGGIVSGNVINVPTASGSWISMRTGTALQGNGAVDTSSAAAVVRQEHADRHYVLGGLGNSQFGIYMINKSRTDNGTDAYAYLGSDGTWTCSGNGNFNDVYIRSDRRNKRNIKKIDSALDKLEKIDGVLYQIQNMDGYDQSAGLVAQQVQEVQPELVTSDIDHATQEERLRLNYNGVIGMLVEAVKELRAEVKELKEAR